MNKFLKKMIDNSDIISFDIFDTLIFRACERPYNVHDIVGKKFGVNSDSFRQLRIQAEDFARKTTSNEEITLEDIYEKLSFKDKEIAKEYEELVERNICLYNPEMKKVYDYCINNKKKVIITSDMYLKKEIIVYVLENCGYKKYDELYLSSETGKKKSTGSIYDYIINYYKCSPKKILHVGDNFKSDFIMPLKKGIRSFWYRGKNKNAVSNDFALLYAHIQRNKPSENATYYKRFGFELLGPAVFGYVSWLDAQIKARNIDKVFFFAREGEFIKRAFDIVKSMDYNEKYLYVSRRSLTVPALANVETVEDFLALRPIYGKVEIVKQIDKIGLTKEDFSDCEWIKNIDGKCFDDIKSEEKDRIINDMFIRMKANANKELVLLSSYLKQEEVDGNFAVVDLGWNGSMQRALADVLNSNGISHDMVGFFLAQRDEYYKNKDYIKNYGYLFNYDNVSDDENILLNSGTAFLELLFSASHGSTLKYEISDNFIVPVLDKYEFEPIYRYLKESQDGAIEFVESFFSNFPNDIELSHKCFFEPIYNVLRNPSKEIIENFGDFDTSDMSELNIAVAKKVNPMYIRKFIGEFKKSAWKVAFLKRNLKINNSFKVYSLLRKKFN